MITTIGFVACGRAAVSTRFRGATIQAAASPLAAGSSALRRQGRIKPPTAAIRRISEKLNILILCKGGVAENFPQRSLFVQAALSQVTNFSKSSAIARLQPARRRVGPVGFEPTTKGL